MSSKSTALGHLVPVPLKFMFIYLHREKHIKNMVEWLEFQTATTLKQGIQIYFCRSNNYAALELSFFSPWMVGSICHLAWLVVPEQAIRSHSFVHPQVCWWNPRLLLIWNLDPSLLGSDSLLCSQHFTTHIHQDLWLEIPLAPALDGCDINRVAIVAKPRRRLLRIGSLHSLDIWNPRVVSRFIPWCYILMFGSDACFSCWKNH